MTSTEVGPLVSVVMPFKDAVAFLERAAHSALGQSWPFVELVLVDDGGTDGSDEVAERVRSAHPDRVRLVSHTGRVNRGIGASRRLGFSQARGELIASLDADDVWEPAHLEDQVRLLLRSPGADVVQGRAWHWWSWAGDGQPDLLFPPAFAPGVVVPGQQVIGAILRNGGYAAPPCTVLFRASLLGPWIEVIDDFPGMYEDQVLHSGLQLRASLVISGATTAWYRQHSASISAQQLLPDAASRFDRGRSEFLRWLSQQPQLDDPDVRGQLDRNLAELRSRTDSRGRRQRAPIPPTVRTTLRRARGAVSLAVTRVEQLQERRASSIGRVGRAVQDARPERLRLLLQRHGADLRGRVLVLARDTDLPLAVVQAEADHRALPEVPGPSSPGHPLAGLRSQDYDCVVVLGAGGNADWGGHDLRHLRRVLRPGGVLLLEAGCLGGETERRVRATFGPDLVHAYRQALPGPGRHPLLLLRAAVPAGPAESVERGRRERHVEHHHAVPEAPGVAVQGERGG